MRRHVSRIHVHAPDRAYRPVERAHRRGSPTAKALCNIQPRSISRHGYERGSDEEKRLSPVLRFGSAWPPLGNQVAVTFIERLHPGASLTIRGQPPARTSTPESMHESPGHLSFFKHAGDWPTFLSTRPFQGLHLPLARFRESL